ncbi:unnamed protein product [Caenorhabditis auriculariae]|uniref:Saposin B-type domain-containing protein n=1 Tax=Caenorhabditis auriculariae TaxID=2777116 RepID=A0A8S1HHR4_9PELO|nr:unnamed protein product [Caenorhabditis auriculariae]
MSVCPQTWYHLLLSFRARLLRADPPAPSVPASRLSSARRQTRVMIISLGVLMMSLQTQAYFWGSEEMESHAEKPTTVKPTPTNLGCFMCTQLLSVTKHRVGLSQNQLRSQLYDKCRVLPLVFKEQCFVFVESSLPEIYISLNYDFSTKDICVRMNLCDDKNPFAVGGPLPPLGTTAEPEERPTEEIDASEDELVEASEDRRGEAFDRSDRIGHKNVLEVLIPRTTSGYREKTTPKAVESTDHSLETRPTKPQIVETVENRLTCSFCEKLLENAKNYAVTCKTDITAFANSACAALPKGRHSDECYQLADKKIADLAKFVDQQVVDALWCAELNRC